MEEENFSKNCLGVGYGCMKLDNFLKVEGVVAISHVVRQLGTRILEEPAASIFRVADDG
jgi:hypothetical protein